MTTNFTHIINDNIDMFDFDRTEADVRNTVFPTETPEMMFEIINDGDFIENDKYTYAWAFEYAKDGVTEIGSFSFFWGSPEECAKQFGGNVDNFFWMAKLNGWTPTGRVWFGGYYEERYDYEERDYYYKPVKEFLIP